MLKPKVKAREFERFGFKRCKGIPKESECIEKPVISKMDRAFLEYLKGKYEYIARDKTGKLYVYGAKPVKHDSFWTRSCGKYFGFGNCCINIDFPMVKWSDSEPWLIEDLKKLEVVENYE